MDGCLQRYGRCRRFKFRWTLNRYEPSKIACQNASHEWTRRLSRALIMRMMRRMKRRMRRMRTKMMRTRRMRRMRGMRINMIRTRMKRIRR